MKKRFFVLFFALILMGATATGVRAATIDLYDWAFKVDGNFYAAPAFYSPPGPGQLPGSIDVSAFGFSIGYYSGATLGTITYTVTGVGSHYAGSFFDIEIDDAVNGFSNENGSSTGTPAAGQTWEIDEPGWVNGDIYQNIQAGTLDSGIGISAGGTVFPDDVSMAMGWNFALLNPTDIATIEFTLSQTQPSSGFYLTHSDPNASVYFSSSLNVVGVPEPSTLLLLGSGLAGLGIIRKKLKL